MEFLNDGNENLKNNQSSRIHRISLRLLNKLFQSNVFADNTNKAGVVFWFVLRLNVTVNNFSVMSGRSHRFLGN